MGLLVRMFRTNKSEFLVFPSAVSPAIFALEFFGVLECALRDSVGAASGVRFFSDVEVKPVCSG
jgi:hypothetical protein